jgi:hypothetical protein
MWTILGMVYRITQTGNSFTWEAPLIRQKARGTINGASVVTTWTGLREKDSEPTPGAVILDEGDGPSGSSGRTKWSFGGSVPHEYSNREGRMKRIIGLLPILSLLAGPALAQVAANEVRLFKEFDYVGASASYKLEADMRHKLVPYLGSLNHDVSSILIGSGVAVLAFANQNFFDPLRPMGGWGTSLPRLRVGWDNEIGSLIIYRKKDASGSSTKLNPFGIYLRYGPENALKERFIALPEKLNAIETRVPTLESEWDNKAQIAGVYKETEAILYDLPQFKGASLSLPGAAPEMTQRSLFYLQSYGFNEKVSSLIVRLRGAAPPAPERGGPGGTVHRAPPAPATPPPPVRLEEPRDQRREFRSPRPLEGASPVEAETVDPSRLQRR